MMTQSHFLVTAFLGNRLRRAGRKLHLTALLAGSFLPDVPLAILTLGYFAYRRWAMPFPAGEHLFGATYDSLYFGNPAWIVLTSLFHAPFLIGVMALVGLRTRRSWLTWFAAGSGLHTLMDVFTHHNDGPLLLFPFDWRYRYPAPISYWHPSFGGRIFSRFENSLDLLILLYFLVLGAWSLWHRWRAPVPLLREPR